MYDFLDEKKIPYAKCGKLIVAVDPTEVPHLERLYERAQKNACREIKLVGAETIHKMQPSCRGVKALHSPHTGIVDFAEVTRALASDFEAKGGKVFLERQLTAIQPSVDPKHRIQLKFSKEKKPILTSYVIACAGLHSDRVAQLSGCASTPKIVPFRGDYLQLKPDKRHLVSMCIYPREGYSFFDISPKDLLESITYIGMIRLLANYTLYGIGEFYRGFYTAAQVKRLRRLVPDIRRSDVQKGVSGVRAQALGKDGRLIEDFIFDSGTGEVGSRVLHVRNAPSPGATSSLAISKMIVEKAEAMFGI